MLWIRNGFVHSSCCFGKQTAKHIVLYKHDHTEQDTEWHIFKTNFNNTFVSFCFLFPHFDENELLYFTVSPTSVTLPTQHKTTKQKHNKEKKKDGFQKYF